MTDIDFISRDSIVSRMKCGKKYHITTSAGTDIFFKARKWIPLDFEVCTTPVEDSINGVIVVEGAFFYCSIDERVSFVIEKGKVKSINATSAKGQELVDEYQRMTRNSMNSEVNRQLAEIGIGFCNDARLSDCFMEAETVIDTCHFCFGNNVCYVGQNESEFHGASVLIKSPKFKEISEE